MTKFAASVDVAKLSNRAAAVVITPLSQNLGHHLENFKVIYSII